MAETRTITGIPGLKPSYTDNLSKWDRVVSKPHQQAGLHAAAQAVGIPENRWQGHPSLRGREAFIEAGHGQGGVSLENLSKLLATLSMQGARRQGITDITAQESGSGFSSIQRHVREFGPSGPTARARALRAMDIARETPMDTLYQKAGGGRGTQGFGLGRRGPGEKFQREGEQDHVRALARKMLEGRSVNRGDPADVLRRYGGGLRRDDPTPVNYRSQAPTFDRFNR